MGRNGVGLAHVEVVAFCKFCNQLSVFERLNIDYTGEIWK